MTALSSVAMRPTLGCFRSTACGPQQRRFQRPVVCAASPEEKTLAQKLALPAAAILGAALLFTAAPDEALAARSGGRMGGSSFSRRK